MSEHEMTQTARTDRVRDRELRLLAQDLVRSLKANTLPQTAHHDEPTGTLFDVTADGVVAPVGFHFAQFA